MIITSCSGGGDDPDTSNPGTDPDPGSTVNKAPNSPVLIGPTDNQLCISNNLEFDWSNSIDPDGDAVKYTMEVSKNAEFTQITHSFSNLSTPTKTISLEKGVAYYWRVKAVDSKNASSSFSSVFNFYTEGFGKENHLPSSPTLIQPALNITTQGTSASLVWGATDADGDALTFDVVLDTSNPPTASIVTNHPEKSYIASSLTSGTTYYWKVITKDSHGGIAVGQVWSFKTE
ncbi:hypothetical protein [Mariniflexile sp. AS56]|uniref:hypothetical protein n=1 Tax=Mariniflexile sp. AS56 TaxID=3063957 RepID=UPI0026ED7D0E|nr:hypothetical protein [Mariniflexile sp. AS56]MDO7172521.1 hypothetical protein [Mariniflexile sp. AS56]